MIPFRSVLAVVDFSEASRGALVLAARLTRHCGAELHVLHAEAPLLDAAARHEGIDLARETYGALRQFVASSWPAAHCSPQLHVIAGPAVDVILDVAHEHRADLVVIDRSSLSIAERLIHGSTTEGLLRQADVSVLVVPTAWMPPDADALDTSRLGPLVVVANPSDPLSVPAAKAACQLASVLGTSVKIVHVVPGLQGMRRWRAHAAAAVRDRVASARQELEQMIRGLGSSVPVEMRVEAGAVANRLAEAAGPTSDRAPILVLGRKAPGSKGVVAGTIAYRVLSAANVPILMYVADQIVGL